jgi:ribose transport system ATP-binding protein
VLDEPTAALSAPRAQLVYDVLRERRAAGHTVLFVSHRLDEVIAVADAATILRDGVVAETRSHDRLDRDELIELIVGRPVDDSQRPFSSAPPGPVVIETRSLAGGPVEDVSCSVRRGEIVGVAGGLGAGRSELLQMLFGMRPVRGGEILVGGRAVVFRDIGDAVRHGVAYVPPDRADAAFGNLSLSENLAAASVRDHWERWRLRRGREARDARQSAAELAIGPSSPSQLMATLSGGNQQKVILGRWLRRAPGVLLLDEPTRGVDVGARATVHSAVVDVARAGAAVIVASDDFEELTNLADRVLVLVRGRVAAELHRPDVSAAAIGRVAFGVTSAA